MTTIEPIALNRLVQSKANVRLTGKHDGLDALKASIAAHGLRQNFNVRPGTGGRFEVIAGGRRLAALKQLARENLIPADMPVPCAILNDGDNATELSLAENQLREAMHPDDQCEAFRTLIDCGMPVEDVAARFGVTPAVVRQRLKLAAVAPKLRARFRSGDITLAHMMALTLTDDHAAQERALAEGGSPNGIRHALTRANVRADNRVARFVGLDAYRQAGGGVLDDLFNPEDSYLTDPDLLDRLADAKLAEMAETVAAEGWHWVEPCRHRSYDIAFQRVYGTPQEGGAVAYTAEQLAHAGAMVTIDHEGSLAVDRGLVRPQDARRLAQAERGEDATPTARPDYPASLLTELTAHRTAALREALTRSPRVALAATVHALVTASRSPYSPQSVLQVTTKSRDLPALVTDTGDCTAHAVMAGTVTRWSPLLPLDPEALWTWLAVQDSETLLEVLACFAALTLEAVSGRSSGGSLRHAERLAEALDLDMAAVWQPTPALLTRLSKPVMAAALTTIGQDALAADLPLLKKSVAAAKAAMALAGTGWLPPVLQRPKPANDNGATAPWEAAA